ncbi:MAG: PKD domain-containing protein, partial [Thermodesulfobacteriota bacterium]
MKIKHFKSYSQNWLIILFLISTISALWTLKASIIAQDFNCLGQPATKVGTNQSDNIQGTAGNDVIVALGGNDKVVGLGGDDIICGGNGLDEIHGGDGNDKIDSGKGNDKVFGETGNDIILGDFGTDTIHGGTGFDELDGGDGTDTCINGDINKKCEILQKDNTPPVADAGADQSVFVEDTVHLDGSGSSDADGDSLDFFWSFTSRPTSSNATLSDPTSVQPSFSSDKFGDYVLELIVNDGTVDSVPDTVTITTENSPPVADAGLDQGISIPSTVQMDGSGSTDIDGDLITFSWSL